nr:putative reverse transcriptase, RNA-dependent DNA polymerase, Gag-polypeptide of LTR copia-type [Tanacetum cinerariifolium]
MLRASEDIYVSEGEDVATLDENQDNSEGASKYTQWTVSMNNEMKALFRNDAWELTNLPKDRKSIGNKWVFIIKYMFNGEKERYEARLVSKRYNQRDGIDYGETISPVLNMVTVRCLLNLVVQSNWGFGIAGSIGQTANANLEDESFMVEQDMNDHINGNTPFTYNLQSKDEELRSKENLNDWLKQRWKNTCLMCFRDHERQSVEGNRMIFAEFLKVKYENKNVDDTTVKGDTTNSFDVKIDYGKTRDDPYSRRFGEYKDVFYNKIKQLANEYDLKIKKKGYSLDDVWEKCDKFHGSTVHPWDNEGFEEEEQWDSGIKKTDYQPPFVNIETFKRLIDIGLNLLLILIIFLLLAFGVDAVEKIKGKH